jgi:hypothetical protein
MHLFFVEIIPTLLTYIFTKVAFKDRYIVFGKTFWSTRWFAIPAGIPSFIMRTKYSNLKNILGIRMICLTASKTSQSKSISKLPLNIVFPSLKHVRHNQANNDRPPCLTSVLGVASEAVVKFLISSILYGRSFLKQIQAHQRRP